MLPRRDTDTQITSCTFGLYHQNRLERLLNVDMRRYICGYSAGMYIIIWGCVTSSLLNDRYSHLSSECEYPKRKVLIDYGVFICEDICPTKDMVSNLAASIQSQWCSLSIFPFSSAIFCSCIDLCSSQLLTCIWTWKEFLECHYAALRASTPSSSAITTAQRWWSLRSIRMRT